ncbi:hypothetical protein [Archangium sp.]|uniref:hypothetical protein n=1 Tax=Archangium sp. TaxID=1872627 RepID=UPI00389A9D40
MNPGRRAADFIHGHIRPKGWRVSNQTNRRLRIRGSDDEHLLILSPLELDKPVSMEEAEALGLPKLVQEGVVSLQAEPSPWMHRLAIFQSAASKLSFITLLAWLALPARVDKLDVEDGFLLLTFLLVVFSFVAKLLVARQQGREGLRATLRRRARQKIDVLLLMAMGLGIPGFVVVMSDGFLSHVVALFAPFTGDGTSLSSSLLTVDHLDRVVVAGRLLQLLLMAVLSLVPALLFYAFDREHQGTLRERFVAHIFRFDPSVKTRQDVRTRYGNQMDEAYGSERRDAPVRLMPARRSPLLVATLVLALGWTFTLLSVNEPPVILDSSMEFLAFFQPQTSALTFGFLGAYSYTLLTVFRSYARRDLQPKIYSHITTRVFTVMVLAWVLEQSWRMFPGTPADAPLYSAKLLTLAFVTGIIPETGLVFISEMLRNTKKKVKRMGAGSGLELVDPHAPLTSLEGIDIYDRARLQDEGVTNVQALARHDVVELMLQTRIPAPRLLDWVDQAILHLHASAGGQGDDSLLQTLRRYGIRTVTDLLESYEKARRRGQEEAFLTLLSGKEPEKSIPRLRFLLDTIKDEQWVENLRYWHKSHPVQEVELAPLVHPHAPEDHAVRRLNPNPAAA